MIEFKRKHRFRNTALLMALEALWGYGMAFISSYAILPVFLAELGASRFCVGLLHAMWGICQPIPQVLAGFFTEHLERKKTAVFLIHVLSMLPWAVMPLLLIALGRGRALPVMISLFVCNGFFIIGLGFAIPVWGNFVGKLLPAGQIGLGFGLVFTVSAICGAAGSAMAKPILDGSLSFEVRYSTCFVVSFLATMVGSVFILFTREASEPPMDRPTQVTRYTMALLKSIFANRSMRNYVISGIFGTFSLVLTAFYAVYARDRLDLAAGTIALLGSLALGAQAATCALWGWLGDRAGYKLVLLLGRLFIISAFVVICAFPHAGSLCYAAVASGVGWSARMAAGVPLIIAISGRSRSTGYLGGISFVLSPFAILVPLLCGWLIDKTASYELVFAISAFFTGVGTVILLLKVEEPRFRD